MKLSAMVEALIERGGTPDQILGLIKAFEASNADALEKRRAADRIRQQKHRTETKDDLSRDTRDPETVTRDKRDEAEKPNDFSCEREPAHVVKTSTSYEVGSREDNHTTLPRGRAAVDDLENRLRDAAGYQQSPHPKLQILAPILGLLDQGMSLDEDVLPVIRSKATQLRQHGRPDAVSWEFFRNAIVEHHHARKRAIVVPFSTAGPRQQPETQMELVRRVLAEGKT